MSLDTIIKKQIGNEFIYHIYQGEGYNEILLMGKDGKTFSRMYWYNDDNKSVYLDSLSVNDEIRKSGMGTKLQEIRENIGKEMDAEYSLLWVTKDTWMHNWYMRRGYEYYSDNEKEKNSIWMRKKLN